MPDIPKDESKVVYVCACLKTKSCPCMTEAKMEGPCACGTHGGPPATSHKPEQSVALLYQIEVEID
jgi:hypothetical protein